MYLKIVNDTNPIHLDDALAQSYGFQERIVHGALVGMFLSGMLGSIFACPAALCLSQKMRFLQPVYIGDELEYRLTVTHKSDALHTLIVETTIFNQDGVCVLTGEAMVKMYS